MTKTRSQLARAHGLVKHPTLARHLALGVYAHAIVERDVTAAREAMQLAQDIELSEES